MHYHYRALFMTGTQIPDLNALRNEAIFAGALDPMSLRFQIVEYDKSSGELLGVPCGDIGFREAIETTAGLIERRRDSHFCLPSRSASFNSAGNPSPRYSGESPALCRPS
ncbi:MAG TPA: hypothetical protein VFC21_08715 [Bryobacteraceae bacterium]|nr:hypothetical protein [Bryobacteraceae bacterium]